MHSSKDCTVGGYKQEFLTQAANLAKQQQVPPNDEIYSDGTSSSSPSVIPVVYAVLNTLKTMQERCKTASLPDCTPAGYYNFVLGEVNPKDKVIELVVKEFIGNTVASVAGCVAIGIPAGLGGALATPFAPQVGGSLSGIQGCKTGLVVGPVIYNGYQVHLSIAENIHSAIDESNKQHTDIIKPPPKAVEAASTAEGRIQGIADLIDQVGKALMRHSNSCSVEQQNRSSPPQGITFGLDKEPLVEAFDWNDPSESREAKEDRIGPIADFLFAALDPMAALSKSTRKVAKAVCNIHPALGDFCETLEVHLLKGLTNQRGRALVLTASSDYNGALSNEILLSSSEGMKHSFHDIQTLKTLERFYDVTYKKVSDLNSFCQAIDQEAAQNGKPDVLLVRAHGEPLSMALDENRFLIVGDHLPVRSCLHNLSPHATIILHSCSTGEGREQYDNMANYFARNSPEGVRIFASTIPHNKLTILKSNPLEVRFENTYRKQTDITYKIDENNKAEALKVDQPYNLPFHHDDSFFWEYGTHGSSRESSSLQKKNYAPLVSHLLPPEEKPTTSLSAFRDNIRLQWLKGQVAKESSSNQEKKEEESKKVNPLPSPTLQLAPLISHPKQSTIGIAANVTEGSNVGITAPASNLKQTSVAVSTQLSTGQSVGVQFTPNQPKATLLTTQFVSKGADLGLEVPASQPARTRINIQLKFGDYNRVGAKISPRKPLKSEFSAQMVVPIYNIPFVVGVHTQLGHPENIKLKVGFPLYGVNKLTRMVGISLPSTVPLLSVSRQSICKTANKIAKFLGLKKQKRRVEEEIIYVPSYYINSALIQEMESSINQLRLSYIELFKILREENMGSLQQIYFAQMESNAKLSECIHALENQVQLSLDNRLTEQVSRLDQASIKLGDSISELQSQVSHHDEVSSSSKNAHEEFAKGASDLKEMIQDTINIDKHLDVEFAKGTKTLENCLVKLKGALPLLKKKLQNK